MNQEIDKEYWSSLDRRVSEHDSKITKTERDYTELSHDIRQVLERINGGLSPSVNKVRDDNNEIKISLKDLAHQIEKEKLEMKNLVRESTEHNRLMIENFEKHRLGPVAEKIARIETTFIYGLVGMLIVFLGQRGLNFVWDKFIKNDVPIQAQNR